MKNDTSSSLSTIRSQSEIIGEMASLSGAMQGRISTFTVTSSSGAVHTYSKLQYWDGKKTVSVHIPRGREPEFQKAVSDGEKLKDLMLELTKSNAASILSSASSLKKKSRKSHSKAR